MHICVCVWVGANPTITIMYVVYMVYLCRYICLYIYVYVNYMYIYICAEAYICINLCISGREYNFRNF